MVFDNHDGRIRYVSLMLEGDLEQIPHFPLPPGYRFAWFGPGDEENWISIEISAKELKSREEGRSVWQTYYGGHEAELSGRMLFVEAPSGEKAATATAYYDPLGEDDPSMGYLHWVAVKRDFQGNGLAKPLISRTLERLRELSYPRAKIHTQTTTWLACRLYLDFGFRPTAESARRDRQGWEIVRALTDHPALAGFRKAALEEILNGGEDHA